MHRTSVSVNSNRTERRAPAASWHLGRFRYQLLFGYLAAVVLPILIYHAPDFSSTFEPPRSSVNTAYGASAAFIIGLYLYRRVIELPGVGLLGYIMPATATGYGLVLVVFFIFRLDYSRLYLGGSFAATILFLFAISIARRHFQTERFYIVPSGSTDALSRIPKFEWIVMTKPRLPADRSAVLIADLRDDLSEEWERLIADAALAGIPVYHVKQVQESLTGRVEIEHLSENSFGSLIPNLGYRKVKRLLDLLAALLLLPLLLVPGLVVAISIKLESKGPVFFRQRRRGYRGKEFEVIKFRTMVHAPGQAPGHDREGAITVDGDPRITNVGRFLRRARIDELPQIWNILKGDMSWIGPRPEALSLSAWYTAELPFYSYRHIVRPGITGWAQVNQGHVADLDSVFEKLHYDFYYIKNFSAWLDMLILTKTVWTVFSGRGAK